MMKNLNSSLKIKKKSQDLKKAESILDAIKNDEKVMQKQLIQKAKTKKLLKDW